MEPFVEVAVTSLAIDLVHIALETARTLEAEAAPPPENVTYTSAIAFLLAETTRAVGGESVLSSEQTTLTLASSFLLASVNFALERGSTPEEAADALEAFAARLRSGEAFERASERREQLRLWAEKQKAKAAERGGA